MNFNPQPHKRFSFRWQSLWMENDDEDLLSLIRFLWLPLVVSILSSLGGVLLDVRGLGHGCTGLSGAIVTVCGALAGYGGSTKIWIEPAKGWKRGVRDVPYGRLGFILIAIGTLVWAFGDRVLRWVCPQLS